MKSSSSPKQQNPPREGKQRLLERIRKFRRARKGANGRVGLSPEVVPSFFTLMNLFCGFLAVIQVHEGQFVYAGWLIVIAGFFDLMDGMLARATDAVSRFGVELDSLGDVVSFGLAPAFLIYSFELYRLNELGMIAASMPVVCGAVRLARYNVLFDGEKKGTFEGLPIPVQAITLVAFILTFHDPTFLDQYKWGNLSILIPLVVLLSGLMVSNVEFQALPKPTRRFFQQHPRTAIGYAGALAVILLFQETGLFLVLVGYIFVNLALAVRATVRE